MSSHHWTELCFRGKLMQSVRRKLHTDEKRGSLNHSECRIFTRIKRWLTPREIETILRHQQENGFSSDTIATAPPVQPVGGDCFLIEWDKKTGPWDLRRDQWGAWKDEGSSKKSASSSIVTFYITHGLTKRRKSPFRKHLSYLKKEDPDAHPVLFFLQYLGDHTLIIPSCHGNSTEGRIYHGAVMPFVKEEMKVAGKATGPSNAVFMHNTLWNQGKHPRIPAARANKRMVYNLNYNRTRGQQRLCTDSSIPSRRNRDLDRALQAMRQLSNSGEDPIILFCDKPLLILFASEYELSLMKFCCTRRGKH